MKTFHQESTWIFEQILLCTSNVFASAIFYLYGRAGGVWDPESPNNPVNIPGYVCPAIHSKTFG